jgi:hypothetical protein
MDEKLLMETGRKKGLVNREHIEKDYFQDWFLHNLFKRTNQLVFKGGTALYKIYKMPRFSEDLDFTMLENFDTEDLIRAVAKMMGGEAKIRKTEESQLFKIGLKGLLTRYNTLRIDISVKNRVLEGFDVRNYVPEYIDINPFSLRVLRPEEMVAEKIHSLLAREKARDLYDLFFLLRISKFDRKLADRKLSIFGMKFAFSEFKERIDHIGSLWEHELKSFVLTELADFSTVKDFVLERVK